MKKVRVVIQSRLSSTRLPAKGLLPVAGMPSVVLCALRAANTGLDVIVATSTESSDDLTVGVLSEAGINYIRGSLNNVLERFCQATQDLKTDDIVVRLTADNLFPDGGFIEGMIKQFLDKKLSYIGTQSPIDGLPYGLSAEVFYVEALRQANNAETTSFEREHVTPWIKRTYGVNMYKYSDTIVGLAQKRCTMDSFQDYMIVYKVFASVKNPVAEEWIDLCHLLASVQGKDDFKIPYRLKNNRLHGELTLGTAQLGLDYGIANNTGLPSVEEAVDIIRYAIDQGLTHLDCARAYGEAESRLGKALISGYAERVNVITKLDPLQESHQFNSAQCIHKVVDASVFRSCRELRFRSIDTILLHRWEERYIHGGEIWKRLVDLKRDGVINKLGVSVQTPEEALQALADAEVGHIQLPFNVLDWRWKEKEVDKAILRRHDVVVHARSTLLQGLLANKSVDAILPNTPKELARELDRKMDILVDDLNRYNRKDLCFAYVRAQTWIDSLVVGAETLAQLKENIILFQNPPLTVDECSKVEKELTRAPVELLDPSKW
ncbi:aldo/keto reductase [Desulfosporosinus lacus]|uniref:Spore coat polysaccharide biosynthesis protein SpsF n=1 Tax=Desulfosporosinus lacus DSM 15449 TaxID=1121420 RepID=A0A1M5UXT6_9FIRM|nr:aldo/keto reductase [Desulfosporosinus lacus]SHH67503.1 spore coat polysaccharide biosynthesis protein SpsF [Desulfosporosinus lacus DSM 15449]